MLHPRLFTQRDKGKRGAALKEHFRARIGHADTMQGDDDVLRFLIRFLEHGGKAAVKMPHAEHIREEIEAGRPLLVTTNTGFLYGQRAGCCLHANALTGIDDETIYVNDSLWDARGGRHRYPIKEYIFGIRMATHGNFNNEVLLKVKPR